MRKLIVRNLIFIYLFNFIWAFGNPMINNSTMIAAYFEQMGSPSIVFAMLQVCTSIPVLIQFAPRLFKFNKNNSKKLLWVCYEVNGLLFVLYGILVWFQPMSQGFLTVFLLIVYFSIYCASHLAMIIYLDYISSLFDATMLGRFYAGVGFFQAIAAISGGAISSVILGSVPFPHDYGLLYITAGIIFVFATFFLIFTVPSTEKERRSLADIPNSTQGENPAEEKTLVTPQGYFTQLRAMMKIPIIRYFALLMILIYINQVPYGFALVFLNREMHMEVSSSMATMVAYVSQSFLILAVGWCMDKIGQFQTIGIYMVAVSLANFLVSFPFKYSFVLIFGLYGMYNLFISMTKMRIANVTLSSKMRFDAIVLANVLGAFVGGVVSLIYGGVTQLINDSLVFIFVISAVDIVAILWVLSKLKQCSR